jgi:O-succinylbenzoic acid--CoA ligase
MPVLAGAFETGRVADLLHRVRPTHLSLVPAMLWQLLEAKVSCPAALRAVLLGGQALSPALARRAHEAGWPLCVSYGSTETASAIALDCGADAGLEGGVVGRPLPGCELRPSASGRLKVRTPQLMLGYANRQRRPGDGLEEGWLVLPDLADSDAAGRLRVLGRADDMLISGGVNVHPAQVEARLADVAALGEIAVTGAADPVWGGRLVLCFTGRIAPSHVARLCRERLGGALRPRAFLQLEAIPRLGPGKIDRAAVKRLAQQGPLYTESSR